MEIRQDINYNTVNWTDISRLYAYILTDTAASFDAKNREERAEAKDIAEREIASVLLDSSFIAEYGCQKANIKSKTLADYSRAIIANNFENTPCNNYIENAKEQQEALLQESLDRMASLNRTFEKFEEYFPECDENNKIGFTIYNEEADAYIPIQDLQKDNEGKYILKGFDIESLEKEVKEEFVDSYLEANLEETVKKLEEQTNTWNKYMKHNLSSDKLNKSHESYTMNKLPSVIEDEGRKQFMEAHKDEQNNALIGKDFDTGETFPTTKKMSNQIKNYIEFCDDLGDEMSIRFLGSEQSAVGKGMDQSRKHKFLEDFAKLNNNEEIIDIE